MLNFELFDEAETLLDCRRQAERLPCPVEVEIRVGPTVIHGVVRDISVDRRTCPARFGIAILHQAPLPAGELVCCTTKQASDQLPREFQVNVKWSRQFGPEGCLSGGILI